MSLVVHFWFHPFVFEDPYPRTEGMITTLHGLLGFQRQQAEVTDQLQS